jgi:hypothetical protein
MYENGKMNHAANIPAIEEGGIKGNDRGGEPNCDIL